MSVFIYCCFITCIVFFKSNHVGIKPATGYGDPRAIPYHCRVSFITSCMSVQSALDWISVDSSEIFIMVGNTRKYFDKLRSGIKATSSEW